jgi:hypothetical protein
MGLSEVIGDRLRPGVVALALELTRSLAIA